MSRTQRPIAELRPLLGTALVCDALDALGARHCALSVAFEPLDRRSLMVGRAFPVATEPADGPPEVPYVGLLAALDALGPDDVYVVSGAARPDVALWGELLTTASVAAGAAGALCEGPVRDTQAIRALGFACFAQGALPYDIHGRLEVVAHRVEIELDGHTIRPGQLIVGDADGVVVVPEELEAEAIERAVVKASAESGFRTAVANGMTPSEAFARHRVL